MNVTARIGIISSISVGVRRAPPWSGPLRDLLDLSNKLVMNPVFEVSS